MASSRGLGGRGAGEARRPLIVRGDGAVPELIQALKVCGGPLARLDKADPKAVLARLERELPDYFLQVRNIVYLSYYESPAVHEAIRAMGFVYNAIPLPGATTSAGSIPRPTCRATSAVGSWRPRTCSASTCRSSISGRRPWLSLPARSRPTCWSSGRARAAPSRAWCWVEAGLEVVCLEQGGWTLPDDHPHMSQDWEWQRQKRWHPNNNIRQARDDFPVESASSNILMWNAVGGSTNVYTALWPRYRPSDFRKGVEHGLAPDWPIAYEDLATPLRPGRPDRRRERARRQPATMPHETIRRRPCRCAGRAQARPGVRPPRLALVADPGGVLEDYDGRPACNGCSACAAGARAAR